MTVVDVLVGWRGVRENQRPLTRLGGVGCWKCWGCTDRGGGQHFLRSRRRLVDRNNVGSQKGPWDAGQFIRLQILFVISKLVRRVLDFDGGQPCFGVDRIRRGVLVSKALIIKKLINPLMIPGYGRSKDDYLLQVTWTWTV